MKPKTGSLKRSIKINKLLARLREKEQQITNIRNGRGEITM